MKIALITDQHFGARGDSVQFHNFFSKFYTEYFFPKLEQYDIDTIVELGDIFDRRKYINFDSLNRCREYFFDVIDQKGMTLHCIVGNHDIYFKNTNRVNAPNLLLQQYPNLKVYSEPTDVEFDGTSIMMLPWINNDNYESSIEALKNTKSNIVFGHLELQGFEMYRGAMNDHGLSHNIFSTFDMVMSGHFHHKSTKDNIYYLGAPYEMNWSDYNDPRGFHIFDTDTKELTYIQNPYTLFHKVFYDDVDKTDQEILEQDFTYLEGTYVKVVVKNKNNPYIFDLFVDKISSIQPAHLQVVEDNFNLDLEDADDIIDEAEDTITIIKKYINNLNLTESKPVEELFHRLYHDALSMD